MVTVSLEVTPLSMPMPNNEKGSVVDCRVSDPQQLKGGSLDNQEAIGRLVSTKLGATVRRVFRKPHSATTTEREDFQEILDYIKSSKFPIHYYIVKSLDRLTREGYPEYLRLKKELSKLNVRIVDGDGIIQPEQNSLAHLGDFIYKWNIYSPSEAGEMLETYKGKAEARDILTRLIGAEIRLVQTGYSVRRPPDGLENKTVFVGTKEYTARAEDVERAKYFREMFELRAQGMDDKDIVAKVNAMGFRTKEFRQWDRSDKENPVIVGKRGGKLLTVKQLQRFVQCTEYAGVTCEKWTNHKPIKMQEFSGIVSIEKFNLANRGKKFIKENPDGSLQIIYNYEKFNLGKPKRLRNNPDYRYKFFPCHICHNLMTGSAPRSKSGKHSKRYHCGGTPSRNHAYYSIPKEKYENTIKAFVASLKFTRVMIESFETVLNDVYLTREKEVVAQSSMISHNVGSLKAQQASALDTLTVTQSPIARKKLEEKIDELEHRILQAESERNEIEVTEKDIKAFVKYVKTVMEHPSKILIDTEDMNAQRTLFGLVFDEIPTYPDILNGTPKLSLAFKLSEDYLGDKNQLVTPRGVEPRLTD